MMATHSRAPHLCVTGTAGVTAIAGILLAATLAAGCAAQHTAATAPPASLPPAAAPVAPPPEIHDPLDALAARGRDRYTSYKCYECHGRNGEGTDDAPDLVHTRLGAKEIADFLEKPSAHARSIGMPSIPAGSPDLQPLVAFVLSLKQP